VVEIFKMKLPCTAIIFDCDGVLFDSNTLKTQAFQEILAAYPKEVVNLFIAYHRRHGGVSRYVKLRAFFTDFLKTEVKQDELERLLREFSVACQQLYQQASLTPACLPVLGMLFRHLPLYVASGSDEAELRQVFAQRGLEQFFRGIYGSPKTKQDCVAEIIREIGSNTGIVLVGDAESDWRAAKNAGIAFIFMAKFSEAADIMGTKAKAGEFSTIYTLDELLPTLSCLVCQSEKKSEIFKP